MTWTKITENNYEKATPYCHKINYEVFKKFIADNKIVSYRKDINFGTTVLRFFQNGGRSCGKTALSMKNLYGSIVDHYMFYKTITGEVIFTSQPYYMSSEEISELFHKNFESEFELKIYDTQESWYCPGSVTLFSIRLKK